MEECEHSKNLKGDVQPKTKTCEECVKEGTTPVELRMCMTCGHVGCCDSSPGLHATKHFEKTKHAVIKSMPITEGSWKWCYIHKKYQ